MRVRALADPGAEEMFDLFKYRFEIAFFFVCVTARMLPSSSSTMGAAMIVGPLGVAVGFAVYGAAFAYPAKWVYAFYLKNRYRSPPPVKPLWRVGFYGFGALHLLGSVQRMVY